MNYAQDRLDRKSRRTNIDDKQQPTIENYLQNAHIALLNALLQLEKHNSQYETEESVPTKQLVRLAQEGHSELGKVLRDVGKCREACFHFGQAWILGQQSNNTNILITDTLVGDYAQMTEFTGFPEIGILTLLLYRYSRSSSNNNIVFSSTIEFPFDTAKQTTNNKNKTHCGCGMDLCGVSPCFVPFSILASSSETNQILHTLQLYYQQDQWTPSSEEDASTISCRFWDSGVISIISTTGSYTLSLQPLPLLLQLVLLKLLYTSSSVGGPFLRLACQATVHMHSNFNNIQRQIPNFTEWKNEYKSHWAYYVLIQSLVMGERIKPHRRSTVPYHIPIWDIVRGLDERRIDNSIFLSKDTSSIISSMELKFQRIFNVCYYNSEHSNDNDVTYSPAIASQFNYPPLFIIGDSHVLSLAWQNISLGSTVRRTAVPVPITGLKAWHCRSSTHFFTYYNLHHVLQNRLPANVGTIVFSAGEIDCREGIGGEKLQKYYDTCEDAVRVTVNEYVFSLSSLLSEVKGLRQILVMPVAPHAYRSPKNGKVVGRNKRRERTLLWNTLLERECKLYRGIFFLNYEKELRATNSNTAEGSKSGNSKSNTSCSVDFVLNKVYNADFTHLNSAFLPLFESAILECGCNLELF